MGPKQRRVTDLWSIAGAESKDAPAPTEWIAVDTGHQRWSIAGDSRHTPSAQGSSDKRLGAQAPTRSHNGVKWF